MPFSSPSSTMLYIKYPFKTRTGQSEIPTKIFTSYFQGVKDIYIYIYIYGTKGKGKRQIKTIARVLSLDSFLKVIQGTMTC